MTRSLLPAASASFTASFAFGFLPFLRALAIFFASLLFSSFSFRFLSYHDHRFPDLPLPMALASLADTTRLTQQTEAEAQVPRIGSSADPDCATGS